MSTIKLFLIAAIALSPVTSARAEEHGHGSHHGSEASQPKSADHKKGEKWETDAPLRASMAAIKNAMESNHAAIDANKLPLEKYAALSDDITKEVNNIFKNCKLSPKADAALHEILVPIMQSSKKMKSSPKLDERKAAAQTIVKSVHAYRESFAPAF